MPQDGKSNCDKEKNKMSFRYVPFSETLRCKRNLKKCHLHNAQAHIRKSKQTCLDNWLFAVQSALMALAKLAFLVDQSCSHCTIQSYMMQLDLGVLREMEMFWKTTRTHTKVCVKEKSTQAVISSYKRLKYLPFAKILN